MKTIRCGFVMVFRVLSFIFSRVIQIKFITGSLGVFVTQSHIFQSDEKIKLMFKLKLKHLNTTAGQYLWHILCRVSFAIFLFMWNVKQKKLLLVWKSIEVFLGCVSNVFLSSITKNKTVTQYVENSLNFFFALWVKIYFVVSLNIKRSISIFPNYCLIHSIVSNWTIASFQLDYVVFFSIDK